MCWHMAQVHYHSPSGCVDRRLFPMTSLHGVEDTISYIVFLLGWFKALPPHLYIHILHSCQVPLKASFSTKLPVFSNFLFGTEISTTWCHLCQLTFPIMSSSPFCIYHISFPQPETKLLEGQHLIMYYSHLSWELK